MLNSHTARLAFVVVTLVSVAAALFRIYTAPDRARERRNVAYMTCIASGGEWLVVDRGEICRKRDVPSLAGW